MKDASMKQEESLSRCPHCGGELRATVERHYSLCRGTTWVESGSGEEIYCENDCDLAEYSGRIPEVPELR